MAPELREQIIHLVDTEAPPIDVTALTHQLSGAYAPDDLVEVPVTATVHRMRQGGWQRNRVGAFALAFVGVIVLVGAALAMGVVLNTPTGSDVGGSSGVGASRAGGFNGWWIVLGVGVIGAGAVVAWRRRPAAGEEPVMQTIERTEPTATDSGVEHLTTQRRWLIVALALVLVVGAVAIGWLIAENRSLNDDLDAAAAEVADDAPSMGEQAKIDMMDDYFATLTAGDIQGIAQFHETETSIEYQGQVYGLEEWQGFLEPYTSAGDWEWGTMATSVMEGSGHAVSTFLMSRPSRAEFYGHVAIVRFGPTGKMQHLDVIEVQ